MYPDSYVFPRRVPPEWIKSISVHDGTQWKMRQLSASDDSGIIFAVVFVNESELRTARPKTKPFHMAFGIRNPAVIRAAKTHAAKLITDISNTTRKRIHDAIVKGFEHGDFKTTYAAILEAIGNEARASMIARTETMFAANQGQREMWAQAVKHGLLGDGTRRAWIATPIGPCDVCRDLEGETAPLDGPYPDPGGDGPPQHPNCRCTEGIVN